LYFCPSLQGLSHSETVDRIGHWWEYLDGGGVGRIDGV
jgi:hypothetical protein